LRESDATVRVYDDARGGDGALDLRERGAWRPGDDRHADESELAEWTEPRSDADDAVDMADVADAERGTRPEYGVPCGSGVDVSAGNASGVGVPGVKADEDQRLRGRGSGAPASGLQPGCIRNHLIHISGLLCAAKDETSVDIMGRMFCCNFLRKSRYDKSGYRGD
jgi:hypothetical protein